MKLFLKDPNMLNQCAWLLDARGIIVRIVEENFRKHKPLWPVMQGVTGILYRGTQVLIMAIQHNPHLQLPSLSERPLSNSGIENICVQYSGAEPIVAMLKRGLNLKKQDVVLFIPVKDTLDTSKTFKDYYDSFSDEEKKIWHMQIEQNISDHLDFIGVAPFAMPTGYEFLQASLNLFYQDHPDYEKNVFIMCRFDKHDVKLCECISEIRKILHDKFQLNGLLAEDKMYSAERNFWNNVCTYMIGCSRGIGVLESFKNEEFNPNIAAEYGFMRALNKPVLMLKEKKFPDLYRADWLGISYETFDSNNLSVSIHNAIKEW